MMKSVSRYLSRAAVVALVALSLGSGAMAAGGIALGVRPAATAATGAETRVLQVGADLFIGDRVITGDNGQVQIKFDDETELVVGPNSSMLLEDYLLRADGSAGKLAINALSGTFRFVTGTAPKDKYLIKTPTGTIGVRGTALDFNVDEAGTKVLLYHGAVILCNLKNICVTLDGTCQIGEYDVSDSQILGPTSDLKAMFKYSESQTPLLREFWVEKARECLNAPFVGGTPEGPGVYGSGEGEQRPPCECGCDGAAPFDEGPVIQQLEECEGSCCPR